MWKPQNPPYRVIDHTADMGFDVWGARRKDLFCHAAMALFGAITPLAAVRERDERSVAIEGVDLNDLWINYLRELLYLFTGRGFLVHAVDISKSGRKHLVAIAKGEPFDPARHEILTEIKAVTYHQAVVEKTLTGWKGRFIVDV